MIQSIVAGNPGPLTLDGTRCYVVGVSRVTVVDPGPDDPAHVDGLLRLLAGRPVETICLTHAHRDHAGAATRLAAQTGGTVAASPETLARCGVDGMPLTANQRVGVDGGAETLIAVPSPGHSADHTAFLLSESRSLFTGDLVLGTGSSAVLHPDGHVGACLASLSRLLSLRPRFLYPGHGPVVENGAARLVEYRQHRLARHAQIVDALLAGDRLIADIRRRVYGDLDSGLVPAANASIRAHLVYMRERGRDVPPIADEAAGDASPVEK